MKKIRLFHCSIYSCFLLVFSSVEAIASTDSLSMDNPMFLGLDLDVSETPGPIFDYPFTVFLSAENIQWVTFEIGHPFGDMKPSYSFPDENAIAFHRAEFKMDRALFEIQIKEKDSYVNGKPLIQVTFSGLKKDFFEGMQFDTFRMSNPPSVIRHSPPIYPLCIQGGMLQKIDGSRIHLSEVNDYFILYDFISSLPPSGIQLLYSRLQWDRIDSIRLIELNGSPLDPYSWLQFSLSEEGFGVWPMPFHAYDGTFNNYIRTKGKFAYLSNNEIVGISDEVYLQNKNIVLSFFPTSNNLFWHFLK